MAELRADVPWFAGVLDARGHFDIQNRRGVEQPRLAVTTNRLVLLSVLARMTGTKFHEDNRGYHRRMCSEHCTDKHVEVVRQSAKWRSDCTRATIILHSCLPYLHAMKDEALALLDIGYGTYQPTRNGTAGAMERLGWKLPPKAARRVA